MEKKLNTFWSKVKWGFGELLKMYSSSEKSFFSKKRVESGVAFVIAQWGMIFFLLNRINTMSTTDIVLWTGVEFSISGWMIHQIQKEKK